MPLLNIPKGSSVTVINTDVIGLIDKSECKIISSNTGYLGLIDMRLINGDRFSLYLPIHAKREDAEDQMVTAINEINEINEALQHSGQ